jgi:hypothetical protein
VTEGPAFTSAARARLAQRQAALVGTLVAGGPMPPDFDPVRIRATEVALLRKRAGEVGARWPTLRAQFGPEWTNAFSDWARGRPPQGSWRDGWDLARHLAAAGRLHPAAAADLAATEARWIYDGTTAPRRRRLPAVRRVGNAIVLQVGGRVVRLLRRRKHR